MDPALETGREERQRQALEGAGRADGRRDTFERRADRLRAIEIDAVAVGRYDLERREPAQLLDEKTAEIAAGADDQDLRLSRR